MIKTIEVNEHLNITQIYSYRHERTTLKIDFEYVFINMEYNKNIYV